MDESLLAKAKRFYGQVIAAAQAGPGFIITYGSGIAYGGGYTYGEVLGAVVSLEAAARQWLETELVTLRPDAQQWIVTEEDKEQHLPQQEYN